MWTKIEKELIENFHHYDSERDFDIYVYKLECLEQQPCIQALNIFCTALKNLKVIVDHVAENESLMRTIAEFIRDFSETGVSIKQTTTSLEFVIENQYKSILAKKMLAAIIKLINQHQQMNINVKANLYKKFKLVQSLQDIIVAAIDKYRLSDARFSDTELEARVDSDLLMEYGLFPKPDKANTQILSSFTSCAAEAHVNSITLQH